MALFALRDIEPGEELCYDYNFHSYNMDSQVYNCYHYVLPSWIL
jgi:SET domain-containing protein